MDKIKLGFVPDKPDSRDYQFGAVMGAPPASMPTWEKGYNVEDDIGEIRDDAQGKSLSCVSFGSTNDIETAYRAKTGKAVNLSQRWIYSRIHLQNGGSSPREAYKLMNKEGVCEDDFMPTNPSKSLTEAQMRSTSMNAGAKENAAKYKIGSYYSISPSNWTEYIQAIYQNNGCGFGYLLGGSMGHFVFAIGYKLINGNQALIYHDSYPPFVKHMVKKGNKFYKHETGQEVQLYSAWTAEPNLDWLDNQIKETQNMSLVRKMGTKEVFLKLGNERIWVKSEEDFNLLKDNQPISGISWDNIIDVDVFDSEYNGRIVGKFDLADWLKNVLGKIN